MTTAPQALSHAITAATNAFLFFSGDIAGADWTHRVCKDASCAAWIVGHLILSSRGMMKAMGIDNPPALPDGFEARYARNESAPRADDFGDTRNLLSLFKAHHDHLAAGVAALSTEALAHKLEKPTPMFGTVGELAAFAPIHMALHMGQISTIRRSLGRPPMI